MEHFIKNIEITNFKSIRHAEVKDCRRVNVFVGPPNVGKSNILEALSGFSYLMKSNLPPFSSLVRFESYSEIFFCGNTKENALISINSEMYLSYEFTSIKAFEICIDTKPLEKMHTLDYLTNNGNYFSIQYKDSTIFISRDIHILKPNFFFKKYNYLNLGKADYFPSDDNTLLIPFGNNIKDIIKDDKQISEAVLSLFEGTNMGLVSDKSDKDLKTLKWHKPKHILTLPFNSMADTLKRLIFYKVAILSNKNAVLLFEEPEAHCYEPYILEFTNSVKRDQNNNQFFIVTHSQYVIEELLRDEESRNETNIYMVGLENNETQIKLLSQDMNKEIYQTGLNVFFNYQSLWNEISEHEAVH